MEIILSVLFILGFVIYFKVKDINACNYSQSHKIDWGKVNSDRAVNGLSNYQVNQNILNGKYNAPTSSTKSSNDTWEDFKKRHPHGSWN